MSLFDSWADRYIKRYGIDAFKKRMEERKEENRKEENEFRQHWDTWAPTGIACPRCGKELRLNEEEMPENYDPWTDDHYWTPYEVGYKAFLLAGFEVIDGKIVEHYRHHQYACTCGAFYHAELWSVGVQLTPDELRRIFAGKSSAFLMLPIHGCCPYWAELRLSDDKKSLVKGPTHRANITGIRYMQLIQSFWGKRAKISLTSAQYNRYIRGSDYHGKRPLITENPYVLLDVMNAKKPEKTEKTEKPERAEMASKTANAAKAERQEMEREEREVKMAEPEAARQAEAEETEEKREEKQQPMQAQPSQLKQIEAELTESVRQDNVTWQRCYELMNAVDTGRLYEEEGLKNFTAWVNQMADVIGCHVSLLWSRLKAGRTYSEYAKRARAAGKEVPELAEAPLSPDTLKLCSTVAGADGAALDNLIDKSLAGSLSRTDLRVAAKAKRARAPESVSTRHSVAADIAARDGDTAPTPALTAAEIVLALQTSRDWVGTPDETKYIERKYHVFTEFRCDTGSSRAARRFDVLAVETLTLSERDAVRLHGVEIKVSKEDLLGDHKMQEYGDFCDAFYIAVPDTAEMVEAAESIKLTAWGLLAVSPDGKLRVVHQAEEKPGVMRDKTTAAVIIKLI